MLVFVFSLLKARYYYKPIKNGKQMMVNVTFGTLIYLRNIIQSVTLTNNSQFSQQESKLSPTTQNL